MRLVPVPKADSRDSWPLLVLSWAWVAIPLLWGVARTLGTASLLFR
jgi:hypothetical protein